MPRYEFLCRKCKKAFELTMTIAEREKAKPHARDARGQTSPPTHEFHGADVEEELMMRRMFAHSDCSGPGIPLRGGVKLC
jgi:hypothetical protein